jgi:hypothetical protein
MIQNRNISIFIIACFLCSFLSKNKAMGQFDMGMENYSIQVLNDTVSVKPGQFAFNSITINNTSDQDLVLGLGFSLPAGWGFVTNPDPKVVVKRGEFLSIPFRISPSRAALGDINYPITILLQNPMTGKEIKQNFFVKINNNTVWTASLLSSNLLIEPNDSLSRFELRVKNNGNKRELFEIGLKSDLRLSLPSIGTQFILWPGKDTTVTVYVASRSKLANTNTVSFFVKAQKETVLLTGYVYFTSDTFQDKTSRFGTMPIDVEYFGVNMFNKNSSFNYFDIRGNYDYGKNRTLDFMLRTNSFNPNYILTTQFYNIRYSSDKFEFGIGSQNRFLNYQINGYGANVIFKNKKQSEFELYGVKGTQKDDQVLGLRIDNNITERTNLSTNAMIIEDKEKDVLAFFSLHKFENKSFGNDKVMVSGGYSAEKHADSLKYGYMGGYRIEKRYNKAMLQSSYQYYSPGYYGLLKGVIHGSHELKFGSKKVYFSLFSQTNSRQPDTFNPEVLKFTNLSYKNLDGGLRFGLANRVHNLSAELMYLEQYQQNDNLSKMTGYRSIAYLTTNKDKFFQTLRLSYTQSQIKELVNENLKHSYNAYYQMKFKNIGINANYAIGPNFYFDYLSFYKDKAVPKFQNLSMFYELNNKEKTFYDRLNLTVSNRANYSEPSFYVRNELYFEMPKLKSKVTIFSSVDVKDVPNTFSLSVSVKKTLDVPMVFKQKYYSASLFLFKDLNNNDLFDNGEEPLSDVNIKINDITFKSNSKGMIFLKNAEEKQYIIDYKVIQNLKGWMVKDGTIDTLNLNRNISIGVPFKQSRMVAGKVTFENENTNNDKIETPNGILIIAINKKGEIFKSSTNSKGEFYFNLNKDFYNIQMPTNIFGEEYHVEKSIYSVDLTNENYSEIEFKVVKQRRKINIRKQ